MIVKSVKIGEKTIGKRSPCYIIADVGSNHGGKLEQAKDLVDVAAKAGVDAVKFQSYEGKSLVNKQHPAYKILNKYSLPKDWHFELNEYCSKKGLEFCSTAFDYERFEWLEEAGVSFHKIASGDITYLPFIEDISKTGKPIILSTGTATLGEVEEAVSTILDAKNEKIILLHCVSHYPTEVKEVNLSVMNTLEQAFKFPSGFSDHTESTMIPALAVAMGACVIEKHITLDKDLDTPDHFFALKPNELEDMVKNIRIAEDVRGTGEKQPTEFEKNKSRITARRSIYTKTAIEEGEVITEDKLKVVRPADGLPPKQLAIIIGKKAAKDLKPDEIVSYDCLKW